MADERFQKLMSHIPLADFEFDPEQPPHLWLSNVMIRTFAQLFGKNGDTLVQLKAASTGELKTVDADVVTATEATQAAVEGTLTVEATSEIPDRMEEWEATLSDDNWTVYQDFTADSRAVTITCETNPLWVTLKDPDGNAMGDFFLPADTGISLDIRASSFRVKNYTGGSNAKYQVINSYVA